MSAPRRRIWLYVPDTDRDALEVVLLGPTSAIAPLLATLKSAAERWRGFSGVEIVGNAPTVGVLRMRLTTLASYDDPIAEAMRMVGALGPLPIAWTSPSIDAGVGMVGTW